MENLDEVIFMTKNCEKKEGEIMVTRVKIRRVELGYKQKDVATKVGITPQYLMNLENGKAKNPSIDIMKRLSEVLECTPNELFFED